MLRPTSECEYDPDHLYHDHREADELRADVELLTRNRDAARMIIGPLSERPDLVDACEDVVREADELRAENERLRAALRTEHFSSNGSSVYMEGPPEHDRSIARCRHPLCIALKPGNANDG
jgi:hypothetical protein